MNIEDFLLGGSDDQQSANAVGNSPFLIATVYAYSSYKAQLIFPGAEDHTSKYYSSLVSLSAGNKVLVARVGGSFVILGCLR